MTFFIFKTILSDITVDVIGSNMYVGGTGTVTAEVLRKKGDYQNIENIIFYNGPTTIDGAFSGMESLKTVNFSKTIQHFQNICFYRNFNLKKFIVSQDNTNIYTDGDYLYQGNNTILVASVIKPSHSNILSGVTTLLSGSFSNVIYLNEITLPKSITNLHKQIFIEAEINSIKFESGVKLETLNDSSISFCTIMKFAIPPSVTLIQTNAFFQCNSPNLYFEDVEKSMLISIQKNAFSYCKCQNITLPNGVTSIPSYCFEYSGLQAIKISAKCNSISETAFVGCVSLSEIFLDPENKDFIISGGILISKDGKNLILAPPQLDSLTIPSSIENISKVTIQNLVKVEKILVESGNLFFLAYEGGLYNFLGSNLIAVCGGVKQLNVSEGCSTITEYACQNVNITSVRFLGLKMNSIEKNAFSGCKNLVSFSVPAGLTIIGDECFLNSGLQSFTFEQNSTLIQVGKSALKGLCLKVLMLPKSLKIINEEAFSSVTVTEKFELESESNLVSLSAKAFSNFCCPEGISIILPSNLKIIGEYAFNNCQLDIKFAVDSSVQTLSSNVFSGCEKIKGVFQIPSSVTTIGNSSFKFCLNIEKIEFSENSALTIIRGSAFEGCCKLSSLQLPANTQYIDYTSVCECFNLTNFTVSTTNQHFSAEGNILYNKTKPIALFCSPGEANANLCFNIEAIDPNCFSECKKILSINLSHCTKIEEITNSLFSKCLALENILLPPTLKIVQDETFLNFTNLTNVSFGEGSTLQKIGAKSFMGCKSLKKITFSENLTEIGESAFEGCYSMSGVTIPDKVSILAQRCFMMSGISEIELNSIKEMGDRCFQNCTLLHNVSIYNITRIPSFSFYGCQSLRTAFFICSEYTQEIGESAFEECKAIYQIEFLREIKDLHKFLTKDNLENYSEIIFYGDFLLGKHSFKNSVVKNVRFIPPDNMLYI